MSAPDRFEHHVDRIDAAIDRITKERRKGRLRPGRAVDWGDVATAEEVANKLDAAADFLEGKSQ